jgi:hypothetical protein
VEEASEKLASIHKHILLLEAFRVKAGRIFSVARLQHPPSPAGSCIAADALQPS